MRKDINGEGRIEHRPGPSHYFCRRSEIGGLSGSKDELSKVKGHCCCQPNIPHSVASSRSLDFYNCRIAVVILASWIYKTVKMKHQVKLES